MSPVGTFRTWPDVCYESAMRMPAQPVDATLASKTERWGLWRCVEDIFEASEGSAIYRCIRKPI
jgi:hypothetical protein